MRSARCADGPAEPRPVTMRVFASVTFVRALAVMVAGYALLAVPPAGGVVSLTLAPLLLVAGYCVLVPLAILRVARAREDGAP